MDRVSARWSVGLATASVQPPEVRRQLLNALSSTTGPGDYSVSKVPCTREDPITIVKFPFSSRQWATIPLSGHPPCPFLFPRQHLRDDKDDDDDDDDDDDATRWNNNGGRVDCVRNTSCRDTHVYTRVEVFRASIMASTHTHTHTHTYVRYLHTGRAEQPTIVASFSEQLRGQRDSS